jgi:crotonobetainyl-CoA:carnitine CoA-transferase CaiB-like acyl-CoA transferase
MGPLSGISVCDLTQNLAGPLCAQILGDLGARVIKVEPPGGDPARSWGPPFWGEDATLFLSVNRNKRSIVLDLKAEGGREILRRLVKASDVFLESARMGVPERLGYDYESIRRVREDIIYLSITAFGDRGPLKRLPGYEPLIQAFTGIMSVTGHPDGPPARVGGSVVDFGTGMWSALGVLSALRTRDLTGKGGRVDTALLDTAVQWVSYHIMGYLATGELPGRMGSGLGAIVPYQAFATTDGEVMIAGGNDAIFGRLCTALGVPEMARDPRYLTNPSRVAHREALLAAIEPRIAAFDTEGLVALLREHSVPCSPIRDIAEVAADPQVAAAELLHPAPRPDAPDYRDMALPVRIDGERPRGARAVPRGGEHTLEILAELGYDEAAVAKLLAEGVVEARGPEAAGAQAVR